MALKPKRRGVGLEMRTFKGKGKGNEGRYLVFRTPQGSYHVFKEVEAKQAARDCGAEGDVNTRELWKQVWERRRAK